MLQLDALYTQLRPISKALLNKAEDVLRQLPANVAHEGTGYTLNDVNCIDQEFTCHVLKYEIHL